MSDESNGNRRDFFRLSGLASAGLILTACGGNNAASNSQGNKQGLENKEASEKKDENGPAEVTANEDLMREHGVLRRALLIYSGVVPKLRASAATVSADALQKTAQLFRTFGEEYHEKQLEEIYIFPVVKKAGGPAAAYVDILNAQHQRGREITNYIIGVTQGGKLTGEPLAKALESMVLMYRNHAAREDTIVFPAWKKTMTAKDYDEIGDRFEDIEQKMFGHDGFEDAARQIGEIESSLGFADLAQFTAPPPPSV